jgi:hypothetical protein
VWVASSTAPYVTELSAATGALVQAITGPACGFNDPAAASSDGTDVWVDAAGGQQHRGRPGHDQGGVEGPRRTQFQFIAPGLEHLCAPALS